MKFTRDARAGLSAPLDGLTAMIVDANVTHRRLIAKLLREHGCAKIHETADIRDADDLLGITLGNLDIAFINADLPKFSGAGLVKMMRLGKTKGDRATPCLLHHPLADDALRVIGQALFAGVMTVPVSAEDFLNLVFDVFDLQISDDRWADFASVSIRWQPKAALALGAPSEAVYVGMTAPQPEPAAPASAAPVSETVEMRLADAVAEDCILARALADHAGKALAPAGSVVTADLVGGWVRSGRLVPSSRLYVVVDASQAKKPK